VAVSYFFQEEDKVKAEHLNKAYSFATKSDIEELTLLIDDLKREVENLKVRFQKLKTGTKKRG
jgi:polyhydroxyalkanoate synthesis regulator phasin